MIMKKTILITGSSTGFGKLTALTLSRAGYQVIATMRETEGKNKDVAHELNALDDIDVLELDVTSDNSVEQAMSHIKAKYSNIDVLINNAGVAGGGIMEAYSMENIKSMYEINVFGVFRMYQAVLPFMRAAKKGLIINLSSFVGIFSSPYLVPYNSTKFALEAISEGMQGELRQFNIENVSIISGAFPTEMNTGVKSGITGDKVSIIDAYGEAARKDMETFGNGIGEQMGKNKPQDMAKAIKSIIEMPEGSRPTRFPLDAIAEGTDIALISAIKPFKKQWAEKYGVNLD